VPGCSQSVDGSYVSSMQKAAYCSSCTLVAGIATAVGLPIRVTPPPMSGSETKTAEEAAAGKVVHAASPIATGGKSFAIPMPF
jgi:hypothetical protein